MVFSTTSLFKGIPCPEGEKCCLTHCIFSHDLRPVATNQSHASSEHSTRTQTPPSVTVNEEATVQEPASKRRRVTYDKLEHKPPSKAEAIRRQLAAERSSSKTLDGPALKTIASILDVKVDSLASQTTTPPPSLSKPVSPPRSKTNQDRTATSAGLIEAISSTAKNGHHAILPSNPEKQPSLNPRLIPNDPAGHAKRSLYLKHIHAEMAMLNDLTNSKLGEKYGPGLEIKTSLILNGSELVQLSLDEEEKLATENGKVYANVIKSRITAYKKMGLDEWLSRVKTTPFFASKDMLASKPPCDSKPIETGLSVDEEVAVLRHLVTIDQAPLAKFDYVPAPPTDEQAAEAAAAVLAARNFEVCERCAARFQVFPERNEDGLLAGGGTCRYHPNRKVFPQKTKADTGPKEPYYPCCNEPVGSDGCTTAEHHVFKTSSAARLHAVMPFAMTPENAHPAKDGKGRPVHAVAFDCEMGYTTLGMELIRVTAVSWPYGEKLVDCLVRPLGIVIDLNSRFSGVWPEHLTSARSSSEPGLPLPPPGDTDAKDGHSLDMPVAESPEKARQLLWTFLTPQTPLIGHAIDNDLNAMRICHPVIVDTVLAFPHPRGLPMRFGLRMLASRYLHRAIQTGGERGHDSLEDAVATGDLVRVKVGEKWKLLRAQGWSFVEDDNAGRTRLLPPPLPAPSDLGTLDAQGDIRVGMSEATPEKAISGAPRCKKRKKQIAGSKDGAEDESTESEEGKAG